MSTDAEDNKSGTVRRGLLLAAVVCGCILAFVLCRTIFRRPVSDLLFRFRFASAILRQKQPVSGTSRELFKQHVLDPIPESIREIRVDRTQQVFGYGLTFRFKVSGADLDRILESRPFTEMMNISYRNRVLHWDSEPSGGQTVLLYPSESDVPTWFDLEIQEATQGYAVFDDQGYRWSMWILIYQPVLEDTYFIVSCATH